MHLQKLVDVGLVIADTRRSRGGGRPARIYTLSSRVASLQFPPRDYQLLAALALDVISSLTAEEPELLDRVGSELGREEGRRALRREGLDPSRHELRVLLEESHAHGGCPGALSADRETQRRFRGFRGAQLRLPRTLVATPEPGLPTAHSHAARLGGGIRGRLPAGRQTHDIHGRGFLPFHALAPRRRDSPLRPIGSSRSGPTRSPRAGPAPPLRPPR